ncbi:MAG: hypothetical protein Tsb0014_30490 [Pleurocapsa sp.]
MNIKFARLRSFHRLLAPIMIMPILLTLITGIIYQIGDLGGFEEKVSWAIDWHKGDFGLIDFQKIYPFLNGIGLLFLAITGISMWWKTRRSSRGNSRI